MPRKRARALCADSTRPHRRQAIPERSRPRPNARLPRPRLPQVVIAGSLGTAWYDRSLIRRFRTTSFSSLRLNTMARILRRSGRICQYLGVALAAHAGTMHAMVLQAAREIGGGHPSIETSQGHLAIGISLALVLLGAGLGIERFGNRSRRDSV